VEQLQRCGSVARASLVKRAIPHEDQVDILRTHRSDCYNHGQQSHSEFYDLARGRNRQLGLRRGRLITLKTLCLYFIRFNESQGSSVGIDARLRARRPGFGSRLGQGIFLRHRVQIGSEAHPAPYSMHTGVFSTGVKWLRRKADHSPPPSAEVKNAWSYTSTPSTRLHALYFVKHRDNFTVLYVFYCNFPLFSIFRNSRLTYSVQNWTLV
jgi:hypothetical protein